MALTQAIETIKSKLSDIPITMGQVIYVGDAEELYFDSQDGTRVHVTDLIVLATESDRAAIIAPLQKLYFVVSTGVLWIYAGTWAQINKEIVRYVRSIYPESWAGSSAPYTYSIPASAHGRGNYPLIQCFDRASGNEIVVGITRSDGDIVLSANSKLSMYAIII